MTLAQSEAEVHLSGFGAHDVRGPPQVGKCKVQSTNAQDDSHDDGGPWLRCKLQPGSKAQVGHEDDHTCAAGILLLVTGGGKRLRHCTTKSRLKGTVVGVDSRLEPGAKVQTGSTDHNHGMRCKCPIQSA